MTPFNTPYDFMLVCYCNYSCIVHHFRVIWRLKYRDIEIYVRGHSRLLEMAPFDTDRWHTSSYSSFLYVLLLQ